MIYRSIKGTSASEVAMKFDCSESFPCQGILLQDIILGNVEDEPAKASCLNVNLAHRGKVYPQCSWKSSWRDLILDAKIIYIF